MKPTKPTLAQEKRDALRIAKELLYGDDVALKIKLAKSGSEITRILRDERLKEDW